MFHSKGCTYIYSSEPLGSIRTNIYPVPDLKNPFLGVHFTVAANEAAKIGSTAIPAFWREQYGGYEKFHLKEFLEVANRGVALFARPEFNFKALVVRELTKYSKSKMVSLAGQLAENDKSERHTEWGKPGIRAQLVGIRSRKLEMDFVLEDSAVPTLREIAICVS